MNPHRTRLQRFIAAHSPDPAKRAAAASNPPAPLVGPPTKGMPDHQNKPLGEKGDSMAEPTSSAARAPDTAAPAARTRATASAAETVRAEGKNVRCVSMPCWELFDAQSAEYQEEVLPAACTARVSIEAGSTMGWGKYIGTAGKAVGIDTFGASAPAGQLYEKFGITTETAVEALKSVC